MINTRVIQLKEFLRACALDAMVFCHLPNIRYLCGFTGSDGVLVAGKETGFLTDSRYTTQARQQVTANDIREYRIKTDGILAYLAKSGAVRVGFEADVLSYATVDELRKKSTDRHEWIPITREVKSLRGIKDESEIALLEQATALNSKCFDDILPLLKPGISERDIALALEFAFKRRGAEEKAFDIIVASGIRGALPHGVASDKLLAAGELVTIDFGCRYQGYHSDETVTLALGEVSVQLREIHAVVLEAHDRAINLVRPGVKLSEIDGAARKFITDNGFGDYFGHGTGHGLGLEVHEFPTVSPRSEEEAREGMVFTIEPGIYLPELGGVRIEDTILVTAGGCRRLTRIPKGLLILPG